MQFISPKTKTPILIIASAALGYMLIQWLGESTDNGSFAPPADRVETDYFMQNYTLISTHETGEAHQWLSGKGMTHFSNGETHLDEPQLQLRPDQSSLWQVNAKNGIVHEENNLLLDGEVKVQQLSGDLGYIKIETDKLALSTLTRIARTESKVKLSSDNGIVTANGMIIDLNTQHITLQSQVRGRYDAQ